MIEYKLTKIDNSLLRTLPKDWWEHYSCYDGIMYWKRTRKPKKQTIKTKEIAITKIDIIYPIGI